MARDFQRRIVTMCNSGHLSLALNCLESLKNVSLDQALTIYSLDEACTAELARRGIRHRPWHTRHEDQLVPTRAVSLSGEAPTFRRIMLRKTEIIRSVLHEEGDVLWADSDVVFLRDPFPLLAALGEHYSIYAMREFPSAGLNAGFLYIRSTPLTLRLYDDVGNTVIAKRWTQDEQVTLHRVIHGHSHLWKRGAFWALRGLGRAGAELRRMSGVVDYCLMPWQSIQNGVWYHEGKESIEGYRHAMRFHSQLREPVVVHYNWVESGLDQKILRMKTHGHWYLSDDEIGIEVG